MPIAWLPFFLHGLRAARHEPQVFLKGALNRQAGVWASHFDEFPANHRESGHAGSV
jgi:hypothetical protein